MTVGFWVLCIICTIIAFIVITFFFCEVDSIVGKIVTILIGIIAVAGIFISSFWYCNCTASGKRALLDQKSELNNGIERVVTIYTANGDVIARYEGKIDLDVNDGGYVKFDFNGKRYIYYNCFVESISK